MNDLTLRDRTLRQFKAALRKIALWLTAQLSSYIKLAVYIIIDIMYRNNVHKYAKRGFIACDY